VLVYWAQPVTRHHAPLLERMRADEQAQAIGAPLRRAVERRMRLVQRELDEVRPRAEGDLERLWAEAQAIRREVERLVDDAALGRAVDGKRIAARIAAETERLLRQAAEQRDAEMLRVAGLARDLVDVPALALGLPPGAPGHETPRGPWSLGYRPYAAIFARWSVEARGQIIRTAEDLRAGNVSQSVAVTELMTAVDAPRWQAKSLLRTGIGTMQSTETQARLDELGERTTGLQKTWNATLQRNTRWFHYAMMRPPNNVPVPYDKPFKVPSPKGGYDRVMFPLDPRAPVWQTRNCRCASLPYVADLALR